MEQTICATNVRLKQRSGQVYSNIGYHLNNASDPSAQPQDLINDAAIDG